MLLVLSYVYIIIILIRKDYSKYKVFSFHRHCILFFIRDKIRNSLLEFICKSGNINIRATGYVLS